MEKSARICPDLTEKIRNPDHFACLFFLPGATGESYSDFFGTALAMPQWEAIITVAFLSAIIFVTVVGNVLVIISVLTHAPLKITPNYFIVSLALADITVSVCVLPFNIVYTILGR